MKRKRETAAGVKTSCGWAWRLEDGSLCRWAQPYREQLELRPSPGAVAVRVRIVQSRDWNRIAKDRAP